MQLHNSATLFLFFPHPPFPHGRQPLKLLERAGDEAGEEAGNEAGNETCNETGGEAGDEAVEDTAEEAVEEAVGILNDFIDLFCQVWQVFHLGSKNLREERKLLG